MKIWDFALERGVFGTTCTQAVLRALSLHSLSDNTCPVPNCSFTLDFESPCAHFLSAHIPTSTYLLTFLSRPAFTVLTLCSCTANLFTIVTNQLQINMESLVSPPLFSFHVYFPVNPYYTYVNVRPGLPRSTQR